jgi:hypothetical protein
VIHRNLKARMKPRRRSHKSPPRLSAFTSDQGTVSRVRADDEVTQLRPLGDDVTQDVVHRPVDVTSDPASGPRRAVLGAIDRTGS